tara:strand:+ start:434 stop:1048 length:615 start_codon:yes stop_codon:yes gene_type:complete
MRRKNRCSNYLRGNIDLSNKSQIKSKCKICIGVLILIVGLYLSIKWINWDSAVIFNKPEINDINFETKEVDDITLISSRWKEKKGFIMDVFRESCQEGFDVLTNLNVRILGQRVEDSFVYLCKSDSLFVNMRIEKENKNNLRLECNETYGDMWKIENERYHPIEYSYISDDIERETHLTTTYEETCMLYQARDLLNGEWQPKSI